MSSPPQIERLRARAVVGAYKAGGLLARLTPRPVGNGITTAAGIGASLAAGDRRAVVERNLQRIHGPGLRGPRLAAKVAQTFESYGRYYYDSLRLPSLSPDAIAKGFSVDGLEHLEAAMAEDDVGPVLALPHLGGWEWAAAWITRVRGWELAAVVEALDPPELFEWFLDFRRSLGMNIIPLGPTAAAEVAAAAAAKQVVCLLSDRDITGTGVEVTFFGERTTLPAGPAVMGLRGGCRVLPTAVYFKGDGIHGVVLPPLDTARRDSFREDVRRVTQELADRLEELIRRAPEQWHLMQPNWPSDHEALGRPRPDEDPEHEGSRRR